MKYSGFYLNTAFFIEKYVTQKRKAVWFSELKKWILKLASADAGTALQSYWLDLISMQRNYYEFSPHDRKKKKKEK